ncbi:hypothetical protein NR798_00875 [Archangium gephyra]|uniref:hypothetical protein n=1 Tax=Archangium gephyra TaxID=48 RepID=UPI0035D51858
MPQLREVFDPGEAWHVLTPVLPEDSVVYRYVENPNLQPRGLSVVLGTRENVTWWKAAELWGPNGQKIAAAETRDSHHISDFYYTFDNFQHPASFTLVLAKAKTFGVPVQRVQLPLGTWFRPGHMLVFEWRKD